MIQKIPFKLAVNIVLLIISLIVVMHITVLLQFIPYQMVWGGRLNSVSEMQQFELISIIINLLVLYIVSTKGGYLNFGISKKMLQIILWILVALFALNTVGNLFAVTLFEKLVFTPLTLVLSVLCFRIVKEKNA